MKFAVITGASRGLGLSIAKRMIEEEINIISIARTQNEEIHNLAKERGLLFEHFACDLSSSTDVERVFTEVAEKVFTSETESVYVFNNAGVVDPINIVGNLEKDALVTNVEVNLIAPMLISNILLKEATAKLVIVNVSSGAGERPIQGWSTYCSTKAGLNMFTQTTAQELETQESNHQIIAFSPGIMDTDMQGTIRSTSKEAFNDVERFKEFKEKGLLRSTDTVAGALVDLLLNHQVQNGKIYNVNELGV